MSKRNKTAALILSGGKSERMGTPKLWLHTSDDISFASQLISSFQAAGVSEIYFVVNSEHLGYPWCEEANLLKEQCHLISNSNPDYGRMHSIQLGLKEMKDVEQLFIHNVDSPAISSETISTIAAKKVEGKYIIPSFNKKNGHPILLSKIIVDSIKNLDNREQNLRVVLKTFERITLEVDDEMILKNINTPSDYKLCFGKNIK